MKKRIGFVSNSSSTSFCIYGMEFEYRQFDTYFNISPQLQDIDEIVDFIDESSYNLQVVQNPECNIVYVGRHPAYIKDDETGKQFRDGVKNDLRKILKPHIEIKCQCYEGEIFG